MATRSILRRGRQPVLLVLDLMPLTHAESVRKILRITYARHAMMPPMLRFELQQDANRYLSWR